MSLYGKERGTMAMDSGSDGIYLPMQRTGWLLVEVALLLLIVLAAMNWEEYNSRIFYVLRVSRTNSISQLPDFFP